MNTPDILSNMNNPRQLEQLYRDNKVAFKTEFNLLYPKLTDHQLAGYWKERLDYESAGISWGSRNELTFVIMASLLAGLIAKLPAILHIDPDHFYQRNVAFVIFPLLTIYFAWKKNLSTKQIGFALAVNLVALVFINLLPGDEKNDTLVLSCIHLPLLLWAVLGISYVGNNIKDHHKRLGFLRYNGDLVIMTGLLVIGGVILSGMTFMLFKVIGVNIEQFYSDYVAVFGLSAAPIVGTYLTQTNPQLVNKVSPVIARIFSPLVLIMLVVYLVAICFSGKDPYNDREFLMVFNLLLVGVMALILFAVAETAKNENRTSGFILFALSLVTVIVNGIALSAILFRISAWGITPNRLAVSGANILMLANLLVVAFRLYKQVTRKAGNGEVENAISIFLPVYTLWTMIVIFIFPFLFHFS